MESPLGLFLFGQLVKPGYTRILGSRYKVVMNTQETPSYPSTDVLTLTKVVRRFDDASSFTHTLRSFPD